MQTHMGAICGINNYPELPHMGPIYDKKQHMCQTGFQMVDEESSIDICSRGHAY